ncbi:hypothetical protein LWI28_009256 [Acer negundo]|uniref:Uncharacterized protein n=1 Tax=Acer negundo TaxID=4023 RepID=A0AAD5IDZ6_ACENE|nr:hypothetical protein LWI28_009256 [Acer negundo]
MKPRFPDLILKKNSDGDTALHVAVRAGDLNTVNKLIECAREIPSSSGTNYYESLLKMKNNGGNTALHEAVSVLVESNKSVYTLVSVAHSLVIKYPGVSYHQNNASKSPLCLAVASDNDELLGYILETLGYILETLSHEDGDSVECPKGKSPVHVAIQRKNWNEEGFCPLHLACENGHVRVVQELLRKWPDPTELIGDNGQSILHVVAKNGKDELVRFLLKQDGIDKLINEMDKDGNTPFHLAPLHHRSMVLDQQIDINDGILKASENANQKNSAAVNLEFRSKDFQKKTEELATSQVPFTALPAIRGFGDQQHENNGTNIRGEYEKRIVIFHIATEVLYHLDKEHFPLEFHHRCKLIKRLSRYMLYLLKEHPAMLLAENSQIKFEGISNAASWYAHLLPGKKEISKAYQSFTDPAFQYGNFTVHERLLKEAMKLAREMNALGMGDRWITIKNSWLEMLGYAARRSKVDEHAQMLRRGGEFLTHVWLLLAHFGLTSNFQIIP